MEKRSNTYVMMFCSVAIAVNIVLGIVTSALKIPLYLDTLGTVLAAVLFGPLPGVIVGALTNVVTGLIYDVKDIPFALVNMAVGLVTGLVCRKFRFTLLTAVLLGLALSFICPAIGTPIGIFIYGGLNGSFSDVLVMALVKGGQTIFQASFLRNVASNLIDKVGTCVVAYVLTEALSRLGGKKDVGTI